MKHIMLFSMVVMFAVFSCSKNDNKVFFITVPMYIADATLPDTVSLGQNINFRVTSYLPTSCETYSHMDIKAAGRDIQISMFMDRDVRQHVCFDVITDVIRSGYFYPIFAGTYALHFGRNEQPPLDKIVVVR